MQYVWQPCTVTPTLLLLHVPLPFRSASSALHVNLAGRERIIFSLALSVRLVPTAAAAAAQKVYTFINIMLCAYMLCVMEGALPGGLCIWMNGLYTGNGSSPGNPRLYFPEIEYDLLKVELMHQRRVSSRAKYDGDRGVPPAGTALLVAEPVLKDVCACGSANWHIGFPTLQSTCSKLQICMHVYTHTNAARHA